MVEGNYGAYQDNEGPKNMPDKVISFVSDIQLMMYGLGDCSKPLVESAELIERIVVEQISLIVSQAKEVMQIRGGNVISPEDVLFLLRRNEAALKRFITYMGVKDEKQALNVMMKEMPETDDASHHSEDVAPMVWKKNRRNYCMRILNAFGIDEVQMSAINDVIKEERTARACKISLDLSAAAYQEYHAARCKSFVSANVTPDNFNIWLKNRVKCKEEITPAMLEILVYMAKETIASLIDMIMTIREDKGEFASAITVNEIREAIRRHTYQQTLTFAAFSRDLPPTIHRRLLAF